MRKKFIKFSIIHEVAAIQVAHVETERNTNSPNFGLCKIKSADKKINTHRNYKPHMTGLLARAILIDLGYIKVPLEFDENDVAQLNKINKCIPSDWCFAWNRQPKTK